MRFSYTTPESLAGSGRSGGNYSIGNFSAGLMGPLGDFIRQGLQGKLMNREDILRRMFGAVNPEIDRAETRALDATTARAAAMGRAGSGLVNQDLADVGTAFNRNREEVLGRLSAEAAGQSIQDMLGIGGLGLGLESVATSRGGARAGALAQRGGLRARESERRDRERQSEFLRATYGHESLLGEREREDRLAQQAFQNQLATMQLFAPSLGMSPSNTLFNYGDLLQGGAGTYAGQSRETSRQLGDMYREQARQPKK
jgi:hypothetical protein